MKKKIMDFIGKEVQYLGGYFWGIKKKGELQMIAEVRGYGAIQNLFMNNKTGLDVQSANDFQDELGKFIAEAITEKLNRERNETA